MRGNGLESQGNYTRGVVTLYYRAPEILLNLPYDQKSDMWSLGCIFAELLNYGRPILPGKNEEHQFELICANIGILDF
jgi:serine/threonine protein kinase